MSAISKPAQIVYKYVHNGDDARDKLAEITLSVCLSACLSVCLSANFFLSNVPI